MAKSLKKKKPPEKPNLKNGAKSGRGGPRPGSGRKPNPAKILRKKLHAERAEEAEYAFDILCEWMHDESLPRNFRRDCANDVLDRVLGKPKQAIDLKETSKILVIGAWRKPADVTQVAPNA
jgi:hypothetical protein